MLRLSRRRILFAGVDLLALLLVGSVVWFGVLAGGSVGAGTTADVPTDVPGTQPARATPTYPPPTQPLRPTPTIGAPPDCTIDKMAARYEIDLSAVDTGSAAVRPRVTADIAAKFPGATIRERALATVASESNPDINNRTVLIYLLAGDTGPVPGGPAGLTSVGPVSGICEMTFYDAETEKFISSLGHVIYGPPESETAP